MPAFSASVVTQVTTGNTECQEKNLNLSAKDLIDVSVNNDVSAVLQGVYVHIPFCFHKCHYCDFYSIVDSRNRQVQFVQRLISEIEAASVWLSKPVQTIFVGGGTPTLLAVELWMELLAAMRRNLPGLEHVEFTVEANPETVTDELAKTLARGGVNRVSIGAQSFNPVSLKVLERWHDPASVSRAIEYLREAGINNLNLDLIFAIPGQTLDDWKRDLETALSLQPDHLSCYNLMYEPNTPLTARMNAGELVAIDQDLEAAMYEHTIDWLAGEGFEHYEISNWARPGASCRHNLLYWTNANWWPFGPSASGHVDGVRWKNMPHLGKYLQSTGLPVVIDVEQLDEDGRIGEELMLGLRLIKGISLNRIDHLLSRGNRSELRTSAIDGHLRSGLLERADGQLQLTHRGLMLGDMVIRELL